MGKQEKLFTSHGLLVTWIASHTTISLNVIKCDMSLPSDIYAKL